MYTLCVYVQCMYVLYVVCSTDMNSHLVLFATHFMPLPTQCGSSGCRISCQAPNLTCTYIVEVYTHLLQIISVG